MEKEIIGHDKIRKALDEEYDYGKPCSFCDDGKIWNPNSGLCRECAKVKSLEEISEGIERIGKILESKYGYR